MNGIMPFATFCNQLYSLNIVSWRLTWDVEYINSSSLFLLASIPWYVHTTVSWIIHQLNHSPIFGYCKQSCYERLCIYVHVNVCFHCSEMNAQGGAIVGSYGNHMFRFTTVIGIILCYSNLWRPTIKLCQILWLIIISIVLVLVKGIRMSHWLL